MNVLAISSSFRSPGVTMPAPAAYVHLFLGSSPEKTGRHLGA